MNKPLTAKRGIAPKAQKRSKPTVLQNTAVITSVSCFERALGFLYRIVLARLLGAEGVGVYQIALSHSLLFQTASGGGIPVTLSRTVSTLNAQGKSRFSSGALSAALLLGLCISLPCTLFLLPFAEHVPFFATDAPVLKILTLSLVATSAYVAIKGYFWGNKEFFTPAALEMAEQIFTVALGVLFLSGAQGLTALQGAERAAWAHTLACVLSFILALAVLLIRKPKPTSPRPFFRPLLRSAAPITAVRVGTTATGAAVAVLFPLSLMQSGMSESMALRAFGVITGMAMPLLCAPLTVIGSLAIVLVPELAAAAQKRNLAKLRSSVERSLLFSLALTCLLLPFYVALGDSLGALAYQNAMAGEMISRAAPILLPLGMHAILTSVLNSLGFERKTLMLSLVGSALFLAGICFLPPLVGVYAFPLSMFLQMTVELICGFHILQKSCPVSADFAKKSLLLIVATAPTCMLGKWLKSLFSKSLGAWLTPICTGATLTLFLLCGYFLGKSILRKKHKKAVHPLDNR
jgi:stage V sporulation protein B